MKTLNNVQNFSIVCVGDSAGGLNAVIIVNHLRVLATLLYEILHTIQSITEELDCGKLDVKSNRVFIIPEKRDLHVFENAFHLKPNFNTLGMAGCDVGKATLFIKKKSLTVK